MHTRECTQAGKNTELLGIEPWFSVRQADALTGGPMAHTDLF